MTKVTFERFECFLWDQAKMSHLLPFKACERHDVLQHSFSIRGYSNCCWGNNPNKQFLICQYLTVRFRKLFIHSIYITCTQRIFFRHCKNVISTVEILPEKRERIWRCIFATIYHLRSEKKKRYCYLVLTWTCQTLVKIFPPMGLKIRAFMGIAGLALSWGFGLNFLSGIATYLDTTGNVMVDIADGIGLVSQVTCSMINKWVILRDRIISDMGPYYYSGLSSQLLCWAFIYIIITNSRG